MSLIDLDLELEGQPFEPRPVSNMPALPAGRTEDLRLRIKAECDKSLYAFCKIALGYEDLVPSVHLPMTKFLATPYIRKMLLHPRLTLKTTVATIADSMWQAMKDPNIRILIISDTGINAENFGVEISNHFKHNPMFRWLYSDLIPDNFNTAKWNTSEMVVNRDAVWRAATFTCMGARGHVESRHFDLIKPDDLVTETHIHSDTEMERLTKWCNGLESLLVDVDTSRIEFVGSIKKKGDTYQEQIKYYAGDTPGKPIGPHAERKGILAIYRREALEDGKSIYPEKISTTFLHRLRRNDPERYWAQFANSPKGTGLNTFRVEDLRYFNIDAEGQITVWEDGELIFTQSVWTMDRMVLYDPSVAEKNTSSQQAILTVAKGNGPLRFLLESKIGHYRPDEAVEYLFEIDEKWKPQFFSIERRGFQGWVKYWLHDRAEILRIPYIPVVEWPPEGSSKAQWAKKEHIRALQPVIRSQYLCVTEEQQEIIEQIEFYPNVKFDDGLDALAQGLDYWPMSEDDDVTKKRADREDNYLRRNVGILPEREVWDEQAFLKQFTAGGYNLRN